MDLGDLAIEQLAEGGYGIPVMKELSDDFEVLPGGLLDPGTGTTVRLTFLSQETAPANA